MRIFATGVPGLIGSALAPELIQAVHHVLGLTQLETGVEPLRAVGADVEHGNSEELSLLDIAARETPEPIRAAAVSLLRA